MYMYVNVHYWELDLSRPGNLLFKVALNHWSGMNREEKYIHIMFFSRSQQRLCIISGELCWNKSK